MRAVEAAAAVAREWDSRGTALQTEAKAAGDYVTAADRAAQVAALEVLGAGAPEIAVLAEESTADELPGGLPGGLLWTVDPIDGTTNYLRGFPVVGCSVGLLEDGLPLVGAVGAPLIGGLWSGARGLGAHDRDGRRMQVCRRPGRGVVATGFPFRRPDNRNRYLAVFEAVFAQVEDLRRAGAASLDLVYTATGSFDGYFELGLSPWDVTAGSLLVLEAGGRVSDWSGDPAAVYRSGDVLAGPPAWHEAMLELIGNAGAAAAS